MRKDAQIMIIYNLYKKLFLMEIKQKENCDDANAKNTNPKKCSRDFILNK